MKKEDFPISSDLLEQFVNYNKTIWSPQGHSQQHILINLSMVRMQIPWILPKILFAKGLEEQTGATPVALTWNGNSQLTEFFTSFGIEHIALNELCKKNLFGGLKALCKTLTFVIMDGTGEGLKKMRIKGIPVGKSIYEDILRTSSLSTIRTCRSKVVIKKIFHLLLSCYTLQKYAKSHPISYALTDDMAYHEGMFIRMFQNMGARVIACSNVAEKEVECNGSGEIIRHNWYDVDEVKDFIATVTDEEVAWIDDFLEQRFQGKNGREIDRQAFAGKKVLSREELEEQYGIDPNKKTVVIMAHTFTDAVFNYGEYYFRDYYDWTEQTLKIAATNTNVNWILKPHPTRSSYNESEDSIEDLFARYKKEHMFFLSDDVSSESIKNIADALVTIGGNAGAEYACFGIPAIIVGKPYYHGQGYTIEPQNKEEYKQILERVSEISPLSKEQIKIAKQVFFFKNGNRRENNNLFCDDFANQLNAKYSEMMKEMSLQYFIGNEGTLQYNDKVLEFIYEYMKQNDIEKTQYYQRATLYVTGKQ